jgi:hypothetical protein
MATKENMKKWEDANKKLAEAHKKREAERGTSKTTNPLMKDFKERMEKRETEKAKEEAKATKKAAKGGGSKYGPTAMKAKGTARNFAGSGDGEGYSPKTKVDGSAYNGKNPSDSTGNYKKAQEKKAAKRAEKNESAPRQRRATGRSEMMSERQRSVMEREEEKRKRAQEKGGSNVVGS